VAHYCSTTATGTTHLLTQQRDRNTLRSRKEQAMTNSDTAQSKGGYQLMFQAGADYARRYLADVTGAQGELLYGHWSSAELTEQVVARTGRDVPLVDREAGLAAMAPSGRAALLEREQLFVHAMRTLYPLLDGEQATAESVTLLSDGFGTAPAGSPVYVRSTDLGGLTVVAATIHVDAATGVLDHVSVQPVFAASPACAGEDVPPSAVSLAANDGGSLSAAKAGLSLAEGLLTAVGPEGEVVAAALGLLELLFGGDDRSMLPVEINQLVEQDLANDHVVTDLSTIVTFSQWLSEAMRPADGTQPPAEDHAAFENAKPAWSDYVNTACDPSSPLLQAISNLQNGTYTSDPPYAVIALPAFLFGATLHLTFERTKLLFLTDATTFKAEQMNYIINVASDYLAFIDTTLAIINQAFADRLNAIGQPTYGTYSYGTASRTGMTYTDYNYVYVLDPALNSFPQQSSAVPNGFGGHTYSMSTATVWYQDMPTGCNASTDPAPLIANGAQWRDSYVAQLNTQLEQKYNATADQRAAIAATSAALHKAVDEFKAIMVGP
jgi:hypothetical protein